MRDQNFINIILISALLILLASGCGFLKGGPEQSQTRSKMPTEAKNETPTLIGKWTSSEARIEFFENGAMTINASKFKYGVTNNIITIESDEGQMEFPFTLNGNTLTVTVDGRKVVYTRSSGQTGSEISQAPRNGGGPVPADLVGKWCYLANVQAQGGGRISERCFILNQDGTYEYYSETSNSNPNGGSSSQSRDSGRWRATATTLTASSNSGETVTYTLEKRNHPKNGDPMLIVDGDAFVTYHQRQPW